MQKLSSLKQLAIQAAKKLDWAQAISINQEILSLSPTNVEALNRLGLAHMQLNQLEEAKKCFKEALQLDKSNIIANKHLEKLKNNQITNVSQFNNSYFIEEPGRTKIIELHRLAGKNTLKTLCVGQACQLVPKNRYISIETESKEHIGALPEDISFRLTKLINRGNEYACHVHSCTDKQCSVHIREIKTSKKNENLQSFPVNRAMFNNQLDDQFIFDEDIPLQLSDPNIDENDIESALANID